MNLHPGQPTNHDLTSRSTAGWNSFTRTVTYAALGIVGVLCLMGLFLT